MAAAALMSAAGVVRADTSPERSLETLSITVPGADAPSRLTLEQSGDRVRMTLRRPSGATWSKMFGDGLAPLKANAAPEIVARNQLASAYVLAAPELDPSAHARVFILFGFNGPDPSILNVMRVTASGTEVFNGGPLWLERIVRHGRGVELIGKPVLSEIVGHCRSTYDPYAVLVFTDGALSASPRLSEAWNRAHYVWAGPKSRTDVTVDTCGAHPRLVREPEPRA
jgi:hypothetical protein